MKLLVSLLACVLLALAALAWTGSPRGEAGLIHVAPSSGPALASPAAQDPSTGAVAPAAAGAATGPGVAPVHPEAPARTGAAPLAHPAPTPATAGTDDARGAAGSARLPVPVQGVRPDQLQDTFSDARGQNRLHDAIDIMAAAGTPVLAVDDGHIEKLFDSERGGLTIYQFEPSGRLAYYYAHLQGYADGLAEGQPVRRGQVLGYVGSTGNASADAPHLHFAIFELGPERHWWEGTALNPYPLLRGEAPRP